MNSLYLSFLKKLVIYTIIISILVIISMYALPDNCISPTLPYLLLFFFSFTLISHYLQIKSVEKSFSKFTSNYMLVTTLKLFTLLIVLLLYVFLNRNDAIPFIISFFIFYILYSIFEVIELQNIKNKK
jgi:hypothetical protein